MSPARSRPAASPGRCRDARGVSLIEIVVALGILSVVLVSLTGILWQMGRHTRMSGVAAARTAARESASSLAHAVRWDSIPSLVGCAADSTAGLNYTRCYEVANLSAAVRQVRVIIAPSALLFPETTVVLRTRPQQRSPFNTPP